MKGASFRVSSTFSDVFCSRSHWFHTILISRAELDKVFNNTDMRKRWAPMLSFRIAQQLTHRLHSTARFAILGLSLSTLLDIIQPADLLRGLLNTITEYDQAKEEGDGKSKLVRAIFCLPLFLG